MPLFSGISNSYLNWVECFSAVWNNNSQWLSFFFFFFPGNMWDTQSNVCCLQLSFLGPFSPSLSVRKFSDQPLRTCASTLKPDLCEKEAPVSCKFNLNMFGKSETRTCLLSLKKKKKKVFKVYQNAQTETFPSPYASIHIQHLCRFKREGREVSDHWSLSRFTPYFSPSKTERPC